MNKKKLFLWSLYTIADSIVFVNFLVYFSKWLVNEGGLPDIAYNSVFVITAAMLLFSAPKLAARADETGRKGRALNISTIFSVAGYGAAALFAHAGAAVPALLAFLAAQYFYQLSMAFYDPMLNDISDVKHRSLASGIGQFASSGGMVLGLAMTLPLAADRLAPLLPSVVAFAVLALPMMMFYRENPHPRFSRRQGLRPIAAKKIYPAPASGGRKSALGFDWARFKKFMAASPAAIILVAFFFYNDALATITNNFSIYAGAVVGMSDANTGILLMVVQVMGAFGALAAGFLGDRIGARRALFGILWIWLALIPVISAASSPAVFLALAVILGFSVGAGWAVSRAYISMNLAKNEVGYGFSFYTIFERFSSMVGPLVWGGIMVAGGGYRLAMLSMAAFVLLGIIVLSQKSRFKK
ncbi:MAG: MFS transporter [Rickettsiales bacterium]|jgi:UMF1 family MFS transporter|nr:MFS transporter [Rickettsiales bacterium]